MRALELSPRGTSVSYATSAADAAIVRRVSSLKTMPVQQYQQYQHNQQQLAVAVGYGSQPGKRRVRRRKSYSESGLYLERLVVPRAPASAPTTGAARARPFSAGDAEDLRRRLVTISGFSQGPGGTWFFKVDVGSHELNMYAVRRRFTDFKLLHAGLQHLAAASLLPELPPHGFYSVLQILVTPDRALTARAQHLQTLLDAVNQHPTLARSSVFNDFLGKSPAAASGYVSLSGYEVPDADTRRRFSVSSSDVSSAS